MYRGSLVVLVTIVAAAAVKGAGQQAPDGYEPLLRLRNA